MDSNVEALKAAIHDLCQDDTAHQDVVAMERAAELMADGELRDEDTVIYYLMLLDQADTLTAIAGLVRKRLVEVMLPEGASGGCIDDYLLRAISR
jgi:hypothetical protein